MTLQATQLDTPLGKMLAIADEKELYFLGFDGLDELQDLEKAFLADIAIGMNQTLLSIEEELRQYFALGLKEFKTPVHLCGTPFQKHVWQELTKIPYGELISYKGLADRCGKPSAYRAVANANGKNKLVLVVPCHRVIGSDQGLGGYNCGLEKKRWLLAHETGRVFSNRL